MTTIEFIAALKEFCIEHGFEIAGVDPEENTYGAIAVVKAGDGSTEWEDWDDNKFNFEEP